MQREAALEAGDLLGILFRRKAEANKLIRDQMSDLARKLDAQCDASPTLLNHVFQVDAFFRELASEQQAARARTQAGQERA